MTNIRVARFTQCYPQGAAPATADRTLGTHDGSARGQGPCAGGDRRIKPVDVIKRNVYLYVAWPFVVFSS